MTRRAAAVVGLLLSACSPAPKKEAEKKSEPTPSVFRIRFETNKGPFVAEVRREWSPHGADRFYDLVRFRFYDGARFFRALKGFVVQFGIAADPRLEAQWRASVILDDPPKQSNQRGTLTFATSGPNSRTTQVFVSLSDNGRLDSRGFTPFGEVVEGMEVFDRLYFGYGDGPPRGSGPDQEKIETQGNQYLERDFPRLDFIRTARIVPSRER